MVEVVLRRLGHGVRMAVIKADNVQSLGPCGLVAFHVGLGRYKEPIILGIFFPVVVRAEKFLNVALIAVGLPEYEPATLIGKGLFPMLLDCADLLIRKFNCHSALLVPESKIEIFVSAVRQHCNHNAIVEVTGHSEGRNYRRAGGRTYK